jgi:hypothetical protein
MYNVVLFHGGLLSCVLVFAAMCFVDGILVTRVLVASACGLPERCTVYIHGITIATSSSHIDNKNSLYQRRSGNA